MKPGCKFFASLLISLFVFSALVRNASVANALQSLKPLESLNIEKLSSVEDMTAAVEKLKTATETAIKQEQFTIPFQELLLSKSGACVSRLATLMVSEQTDSVKKRGGELFGDIRLLLVDIQSINKKTISRLDESHLESLKEPAVFFKSDVWQKPHVLVSLSSYWLGWNDYYTGLPLADDDPGKQKLLEEAIRSFSFSFPDLNEDTIIASALLGRALCRKELKAYDNATDDLISAKSHLTKEDDLFFKILFEEASIRYQTGELDPALRLLDDFFESFPDATIPEGANLEGNRLRAKILLALLEKDELNPDKEDKTAKKAETFDRFKKLADGNKQLGVEFYRYVKAHADELENLSYEALGIWGTAAIGDYLFDKNNYTEAMGYYLHLNIAPEAVPDELMSGIWFRLANIYHKQEEWQKTIGFLETLVKKFPEGPHTSEASGLFYEAALKLYTAEANEQTYGQYIEAAKTYTAHCQGCPELSEAHFQLGKYYQKKGQTEKANLEYSLVGTDSPNFGIAQYPLLQDITEQLGYLEKQEQGRSEKATKLYTEGIKRITEFHNQPPEKDGEDLGKTQAAHMVILEAALYGYGPQTAAKETLKRLDGFEQHYPADKKLILSAKMLRIDAHYALGMLPEAQTEIASILPNGQIDPDQYAFLQELANRLYRQSASPQEPKDKNLSDHQSAAAHMIYEKLYQISIDDPAYHEQRDAIRHRMAEMYMNEDNRVKARELYEEILRKNPQSASAVYNLGAIYEKNGQWTEALENWQRFSDRCEVGSYHWYEARYRTARAFVELGKKDMACNIIKTTFTLHPEKGDDNLVKKLQVMQLELCAEN